jgi:SAM-dependent methyltransferase
VYADRANLEVFLRAMTGVSLMTGRALSTAFPWHRYGTFADIGCAQGAVPVEIARDHPNLLGYGFDLPPVGPVFDRYVGMNRLSHRVSFIPGDFFQDSLPEVDVLVMGHILHDWDLGQKKLLLQKAYAALPPGGSLIVYDAMIDDDRRQNTYGLLMSLNMLIETPAGFDYTGADCTAWMREAGFREVRVEPLQGPYSMAVGVK